jgi:hypothetical protein
MFDIVLFLVAVGLFMILDMIKPSYGVVFDEATGEYVDTAFIVLINADTNTEIARSLTDMCGRYYFFVQPGRYRLLVERTHFSVTHTRSPLVILYGSPYQGGVIERKNESAISVPLALHKDAPDWNHENKLAIKRDIAGYSVWLRWFGLVIAASHAVVSLGLFITTHSLLYGVLAVMTLVWWVVFLYDHSPVVGRVGWDTQGRRGGFMQIHGYADVLIKKIPLSDRGYYWALIPPGNYTVRLYEYIDDSHTTNRMVREYHDVSVSTGILNKSFLVE